MKFINSLLDRISVWPGQKKAVGVLALFLLAAALAGGISLSQRSSHKPVGSNKAAHQGAARNAASLPREAFQPKSPVAGLECRLPISNYIPGSGGFIDFPGGTFSSDPSSNVQILIMNGYGSQGLSYLRGPRRWVPAARSAVRPDGKVYATFQQQSGLVVVDVSTDAGRRLGSQANVPASQARNETGIWQVLDAATEGVYAVPQGYGQAPQGLWLFPYDGNERPVTTSGYWQAVGGGGAWGTSTPAVPQGAANILIRRDLKSGTEAKWFIQPVTDSRVVGFDADEHPVIQGITPTSTDIWLATGSGSARRLASFPKPAVAGTGGGVGVQSVLGDSHGLWVATTDGLYFAPPSAELVKVSTVTGFLAGSCS